MSLSSSPTLLSRPTMSDPVMTPRTGKQLSVDELEQFKNLLPDLMTELTYSGHHTGMPDVNQHLAKVSLKIKSNPMKLTVV